MLFIITNDHCNSRGLVQPLITGPSGLVLVCNWPDKIHVYCFDCVTKQFCAAKVQV